MLIVYTLRYNIKGSVATSRAMPTPFYLSIMKLASSGFIYTSLIIASCTPENIISNTVKPLNNMHADTFGAGPLSLLERLSDSTKTN